MKKLITTTVALAATMMISTGAMAVVPDMIPVQGVLANTDESPVDALTDMTFTLYDGETSSTVLWTDTFLDVDVDMGFFTVYLGGGAALDFSTLLTNAEVWMGVTVESDPEMTRVPFYTVPFAIEAQVCERVGTLTETDINNNFATATHDHDADYLASTYVPSWTTLTDIPAGFADNTDDGYSTEAELTTLLDDNYSPLSHNHDLDYMPITYMPSWNDLTDIPAGFADNTDDGFTSEAELTTLLDDNYAALAHVHDAADITTGTLSTDRYSAYADLTAEGALDNNAGTDLLTRAQADGRYTRYALSSHLHYSYDDGPDNGDNGWNTVWTSGDDLCSSAYALGFNFTYFGTNYSHFRLSTNGTVWLGTNTSMYCSSTLGNTALPNSSYNYPFIAAYWDDLVVTAVRYKVEGSAGGRVLFVWYNAQTWSGGHNINFWVSLHEGSDTATITYYDTSASAKGLSATIGFQGSSSEGMEVSYNAGVLDDNAATNTQYVSLVPQPR